MITLESIIEAHYDCRQNKRRTVNATRFEVDSECELVRLTEELNTRTYSPGRSIAFVVRRPKYREVFAATYRDRVVHHWICERIIPILEEHLSERRFNCRQGKGTQAGVEQLTKDIKTVSENYTKDCWIAEGDIQGFFMAINKAMLADLTESFINKYYTGDDKEDLLWLTRLIIMHSPEKDCIFQSPRSMWGYLPANKSLFTNGDGLGMPIGNLPSQTLANLLLMVALDIILEKLGFAWGGYADDFYMVDKDKKKILAAFPLIRESLRRYGLTLHPKKFYIQHYTKGVRFTGVTVKPRRRYTIRRTARSLEDAVRKLDGCDIDELQHIVCSINSYLGAMIHYNTYAIRRYVLSKPYVYKYCYVGGRFAKVVIKKKYRQDAKTQKQLTLASTIPQGRNIELYSVKRSA